MILLLVRLAGPGRGGFPAGLDDIARGGVDVRDARSTSGDRKFTGRTEGGFNGKIASSGTSRRSDFEVGFEEVRGPLGFLTLLSSQAWRAWRPRPPRCTCGIVSPRTTMRQ